IPVHDGIRSWSRILKGYFEHRTSLDQCAHAAADRELVSLHVDLRELHRSDVLRCDVGIESGDRNTNGIFMRGADNLMIARMISVRSKGSRAFAISDRGLHRNDYGAEVTGGDDSVQTAEIDLLRLERIHPE